MAEPTLFDLWRQAGGNRDRYRALLREHGLLVPLKPGEKPEPLPCGWPGPITGWRCVACDTPGQLGQTCEQCGAQAYRSELTTGEPDA